MAAVVAKIWVNAAYIFILFYKYVTSPRLGDFLTKHIVNQM